MFVASSLISYQKHPTGSCDMVFLLREILLIGHICFMCQKAQRDNCNVHDMFYLRKSEAKVTIRISSISTWTGSNKECSSGVARQQELFVGLSSVNGEPPTGRKQPMLSGKRGHQQAACYRSCQRSDLTSVCEVQVKYKIPVMLEFL